MPCNTQGKMWTGVHRTCHRPWISRASISTHRPTVRGYRKRHTLGIWNLDVLHRKGLHHCKKVEICILPCTSFRGFTISTVTQDYSSLRCEKCSGHDLRDVGSRWTNRMYENLVNLPFNFQLPLS